MGPPRPRRTCARASAAFALGLGAGVLHRSAADGPREGSCATGFRRLIWPDLGRAPRPSRDDGPSAAMSRETHLATCCPDAEIQSAPPAFASVARVEDSRAL